MRLGHIAQFRIRIALLIVGVFLVGCAARTSGSCPASRVSPRTPTAETTAGLTPVQTPALPPHRIVPCVNRDPAAETAPDPHPYGVVYAFSKSDWTEADREAIREHLEYLRGLGVNTIVQVFSSRLIGTGAEKDWLILLDEAERMDMRVIARLWPLEEWHGETFNLDPIRCFLAVVQDHPALLAYLGLHEPLEKFDSDQMRDYYASVKRLAPEVLIAHYMANMAWFDQSLRFRNRELSSGICDICIVWYTPARYLDGEPLFEGNLFQEIVRANRELLDKRAPDAQLWVMGQTYAQHQHRHQLRMPSPDEMELMYTIAEQERVDGFLWYPWVHGSIYDQVLSDPEMESQRQAVRQIYESHILEAPTQ